MGTEEDFFCLIYYLIIYLLICLLQFFCKVAVLKSSFCYGAGMVFVGMMV